MGYKSVCLDCRKSLNVKLENNSERIYPCSECGKPMTLISHRFKPPRKTENKKWETVEFLIEHGFYYQHVYENVEVKKSGIIVYENYARYPENIKEAKEFVEKYKEQAQKVQ
jgi:DNA-directed RNA polymerase subunit RPC12/RpoP